MLFLESFLAQPVAMAYMKGLLGAGSPKPPNLVTCCWSTFKEDTCEAFADRFSKLQCSLSPGTRQGGICINVEFLTVCQGRIGVLGSSRIEFLVDADSGSIQQ